VSVLCGKRGSHSGRLQRKLHFKNKHSCFLSIWHGPYRKRSLPQFFIAAGTFLPNHYLATIMGYDNRPTDSSLIRHRSHRKWRVKQYAIVMCVRCHGNMFTYLWPGKYLTEPLPCKERRDEYTQRLVGGLYIARRWERISWNDIHIKLHKDWFICSEVDRERFTDTQDSKI
jgi:hypothetical protein